MKFFDAIFIKIRASAMYNDAMNLTSKKRYQDANMKLNSVYEILSSERPSKNVSPLYNLLSALLSLKLKDFTTSVKSSKVFVHQLNNVKSFYYIKYKLDSRNYLMYYCKGILNSIVDNTENYDAKLLSDSIDILYVNLNIESVDNIYRQDFPISGPLHSELCHSDDSIVQDEKGSGAPGDRQGVGKE